MRLTPRLSPITCIISADGVAFIVEHGVPSGADAARHWGRDE